MGIQPGGEVVEARRRLRAAVDAALDRLDTGSDSVGIEGEHLDFKEEAGRRGRGGQLLPGSSENQAVAVQIANEVACLANSRGGGALIVGIADDGRRVGAETDPEWLRHRVYELVDVAPDVSARELADGTRVLVILVAEAREPVEDGNGRLRWRVGANCVPVDRSEWWHEHNRRLGADPLAGETDVEPSSLPASALVAVRRLLRTAGPSATEFVDGSDRELLTRLGVLLPTGRLTAAGVHMLAPAPRTVLELSVLDVPGGDVVAQPVDLAGLSVIEQLVEVETRLDALDTAVVLGDGLRLGPVRRVPWPAVREAVLNAVVHRDWLSAETVRITWVQADFTLDVVSPGGFVGGVTADSVLSARYARNPALADFARALGLVERQGIGVDRMYREMVVLGHRPPIIREEAGPQVRTRLVGGEPLTAVMAVVQALTPALRQRDVRVAVALYLLLRDGFLTAATLASLLQAGRDEADAALDVIAECVVDGEPVVRPVTGGAWLAGTGVVRRATADAEALRRARRRGLLRWWRPDADSLREVVDRWLSQSGRISSGELAEITGFTVQGALVALNRLAADGIVVRGDAATGRRAHFVRAKG